MIFTKMKKGILLFLLWPFAFYSQVDQAEAQFYNWFDNLIGIKHTNLFNGKQYIDTDVNKIFEQRHAFFLSDKAQIGTILYSGQTYFDIPMKYNLETDHVIVSLKSNNTTSLLELIDDNIKSFSIKGFRFEKLDTTHIDQSTIKGFYEVMLTQPEFSLYKKNRKNRKERFEDLGRSKIYYEFIADNSYVLFYQNIYRDIASRNDILNIFPKKQKEIKLFFKENKSQRKTDYDTFLKELFSSIIHDSNSEKNL